MRQNDARVLVGPDTPPVSTICTQNGSVDDGLRSAREALARHDWEAGAALAAGVRLDDPAAEAERLYLLAEALWWLGRLDPCIEARQGSYRAYESLGDHRRAGLCAVWL